MLAVRALEKDRAQLARIAGPITSENQNLRFQITELRGMKRTPTINGKWMQEIRI